MSVVPIEKNENGEYIISSNSYVQLQNFTILFTSPKVSLENIKENIKIVTKTHFYVYISESMQRIGKGILIYYKNKPTYQMKIKNIIISANGHGVNENHIDYLLINLKVKN